jgi:pimeloyl-ACP methyl ester carboxylesterase
VLKVASSPTTKAVDTTVAPKLLVQGTDYKAEVSPGSDVGSSILTIKPLHPLAASTITGGTTPVPATYLVIVTQGLRDTSGSPATPSDDFAKVLAADLPVLKGGKMGSTGDKTLDQVALFTLPQLALAAGVGIDPSKIAVSFSFSTEYLGIALGEIAAGAAPTAQPTGVGIVDTGETVCDVLAASGQIPSNSPTVCNAADPGSTLTEVFAGTVALPYYLTVPAKGSTAALTDSWHNAAGGDIALNANDPTSFVPKATVAQNVIPILVALPTTTSGCPPMPVTGWPVVIFQHGITRNREDMLAIAAALSVGGITHGLCAAVVAIDLPLHGVTNTKDPFYTKGFERTFDMDSNGAAGATGSNIAGSGSFFINLSSTITSRDNLREGAADLLNLVATLPNMAAVTPPATLNTFDHSKVFFVGHSLGGIVGTTFLGADTEGAGLTSTPPKVSAAVLAMPGGHLAELLRRSPAFEPTVDKGLAQQGIVKGTQSYYDFYSQAQAVVEDGDPANYATLAAEGHPIHMIEVVGGHDSHSPPDQVVPNSATDVLIGEMGITTPITASSLMAPAAPTLAQFTTGDHSSILSPAAPAKASATVQADYAAVTVEMQSEAASVVFNTLGGTPAVTVTDNTFLSPTLKK